MVGQQQTVLPLLAEEEFDLTGYTFIFTYVAAFGLTKAAANYAAGTPAPWGWVGRALALQACWPHHLDPPASSMRVGDNIGCPTLSARRQAVPDRDKHVRQVDHAASCSQVGILARLRVV